jgi:hypothetical protein
MLYRVAIGRICWPWQLVYLLLLEKVLHYADVAERYHAEAEYFGVISVSGALTS